MKINSFIFLLIAFSGMFLFFFFLSFSGIYCCLIDPFSNYLSFSVFPTCVTLCFLLFTSFRNKICWNLAWRGSAQEKIILLFEVNFKFLSKETVGVLRGYLLSSSVLSSPLMSNIPSIFSSPSQWTSVEVSVKALCTCAGSCLICVCIF